VDDDPDTPDEAWTDYAAAARHERYVLTLFVSGASPRSERAIAEIRKLCEEKLQGRFELQVVDLHQQPALAVQQGIVAAPTLIRHLPLPLRLLVGDLSNSQRVLVGLDLHPLPASEDRGEWSAGDEPDQ
jgi:circadian clock protein KaiB